VHNNCTRRADSIRTSAIRDGLLHLVCTRTGASLPVLQDARTGQAVAALHTHAGSCWTWRPPPGSESPGLRRACMWPGWPLFMWACQVRVPVTGPASESSPAGGVFNGTLTEAPSQAFAAAACLPGRPIPRRGRRLPAVRARFRVFSASGSEAQPPRLPLAGSAGLSGGGPGRTGDSGSEPGRPAATATG
jgi:hypothetical protein